MEDAEDIFLRAIARGRRYSTEEEFSMLLSRYREVVMKEPHRNCSAWAEETVLELEVMQKKDSKKWDARRRPEQRRLRAVLRWLHRRGVTEIEYRAVIAEMDEEIAAILYLWSNWGAQYAFPVITDELLR